MELPYQFESCHVRDQTNGWQPCADWSTGDTGTRQGRSPSTHSRHCTEIRAQKKRLQSSRGAVAPVSSRATKPDHCSRSDVQRLVPGLIRSNNKGVAVYVQAAGVGNIPASGTAGHQLNRECRFYVCFAAVRSLRQLLQKARNTRLAFALDLQAPSQQAERRRCVGGSSARMPS